MVTLQCWNAYNSVERLFQKHGNRRAFHCFDLLSQRFCYEFPLHIQLKVFWQASEETTEEVDKEPLYHQQQRRLLRIALFCCTTILEENITEVNN